MGGEPVSEQRLEEIERHLRLPDFRLRTADVEWLIAALRSERERNKALLDVAKAAQRCVPYIQDRDGTDPGFVLESALSRLNASETA